MQSSRVSSLKSAIFALTTVLQTKYLRNVDMVNSLLLVSKGGIGIFLMCTHSTIWLDHVFKKKTIPFTLICYLVITLQKSNRLADAL